MKQVSLLFAFFFALYVLSMGGHGYGGVGTTTYDVTRSIVLRGDFAIKPVPWGKIGQDGRFYAQYGIGHSLYNLPFYGFGHLLTKLAPRLVPQYDRITMLTTLIGQPFISAWTVVLLWLLYRKIGYADSIATLCTLYYGLTTQVWVYAKFDFSEPLLTFFLLATVYWLVAFPSAQQTSQVSEPCEVLKTNVCGPKTPGSLTTTQMLFAGLCLGIAVTIKVTALMILPVFLFYLVKSTPPDSRWKRVVAFLLPVLIIGAGTVGWYNFVRFGTPFETGYDNEFNFWPGHVWRQFWENLFGLEGSIFLYSPLTLLAVFGSIRFYKRFQSVAFLFFGVILTFFLFYPFTTNELYYGPRYLTPTLPLLILIVGTMFSSQNDRFGRVKRILIGLLVIVGIGQQLIGVMVNYHTYYWRIQYTLPLADETVRLSPDGQQLAATPRLPHLLGNLWLIKEGLRDLFSAEGMPLSGVTLLTDAHQQNAWIPYYGLDFWWCHPQVIQLLGWRVWSVLMVGWVGVLGGIFVHVCRHVSLIRTQ